MPFGEVFLEEKNDKWNTPYKFNAKEFDEETGLYYYGARYFDSKISVWYSVDPLAGYNPIFETEHYINGQHNGGVYNSGNLNPYIYCYQNPVRYIDPNGKQADVTYGIKGGKDDDTPIINASSNLKNKSNVLTVVSHAGPHGARVVENNKKGELIDGSSSFNTYMTRDSEKWRNRGEIGNLVVVMYGCNLARDRVSTKKDQNGNEVKVKDLQTRIQIISKSHPDQVFIGSTTSVNWTDYMGIIGTAEPTNGGNWRVYKAGVLIDEYNASWNPNQFKQEWFDNPKEIQSTSTTPPAIGPSGNNVPNEDVNKSK
ncbi:MAG: RHS repeat-associated core domain-containing protein [Flavobacteriaceae bacterium]|nr:RHS repeat-associated core domain-containing protein [Flavobacteriaceae bacterium]